MSGPLSPIITALLTSRAHNSRVALLVHPLPARRARFPPPRLVRECGSVQCTALVDAADTVAPHSVASVRGRRVRVRVHQPAVTSLAGSLFDAVVACVAITTLKKSLRVENERTGSVCVCDIALVRASAKACPSAICSACARAGQRRARWTDVRLASRPTRSRLGFAPKFGADSRCPSPLLAARRSCGAQHVARRILLACSEPTHDAERLSGPCTRCAAATTDAPGVLSVCAFARGSWTSRGGSGSQVGEAGGVGSRSGLRACKGRA